MRLSGSKCLSKMTTSTGLLGTKIQLRIPISFRSLESKPKANHSGAKKDMYQSIKKIQPSPDESLAEVCLTCRLSFEDSQSRCQ